MKTGFDSAAESYDDTFTNTSIGILQRKAVHAVLSDLFEIRKPEKVLEINCGTGTDALWLADQGFKVIATDISERMIEMAKAKDKCNSVHFEVAGFDTLAEKFYGRQFELIFSNFGGLNCLTKKELGFFFEDLGKITPPNAVLALVVMPKNTLWERFYFFAKGQWSEIQRRKKEFAIADVNGEKIVTFYHNPNEIVRLAKPAFKLNRVYPIGFFVPPSYLEPVFMKHPNILASLGKLERKIRKISWLARFSDHYCIILGKE
ncbi:MAG: methylase [Flavobacterium sp. BFFFF1]|uniref:class I SAM-dependent DNA methyltransferase n=1 Tax=Flavobacterium sp. BFFFF1 TaxID=2015557 RepID=UPI000BC985C4|nr:class I SAM-dependent methyltransferase [Flavobacterium sp. BFFFF1]OYU82274.1 MAG: methylase [Flavobacterium sp. BFFFF1]